MRRNGVRPHSVFPTNIGPIGVKNMANGWLSQHRNEPMPRNYTQRQVSKHGRKAILVVILCLTVATGVTLLNIGMVLSKPDVVVPLSRPSETNMKLVREFYVAVNDVIYTGDAVPLNAIVAPDLTWCQPCSGQSPTPDGLSRYLQQLHRIAPDAHLEVGSVVAGLQGTVVANVRVSGYPLMDESMPWGPVDTLRIAGGLIAERSNGPNGVALTEPMVRTQFDALPPAVTGVVMARLTFALKSGVDGLVSSGPTILVVESGEISVHIAAKGRIVRAGGVETSAGNDATTLHQGDAAIVPPGIRHELLQVGTEPAVAVGVTLFFIENGTESSIRRGPELAPFSPVSSMATSSLLAPTVQVLRGGDMGAWPSGPVDVAMGRIFLEPGARLVPPLNESILLATEAGAISISSGDSPLFSATGIGQPSESIRELRNDSDGLVIVLILTVSRTAD